MTDKSALQKGSQMLIYQSEDGQTRIEVQLEAESVWLTQKQMADLFRTSKQNISHHIQNIFEEGELTSEATVKEYLTVRRVGNAHHQLAIAANCVDWWAEPTLL